MFRLLLTMLSSGLFFGQVFSQASITMLNDWSERSPIEKIYLHTDRTDYTSGETTWFKVYTYSDYIPSDKSTTVFVELLNRQAIVIDRQVLPVFGGYSKGQIKLPDSLQTGTYMLRAYTANMLNQDAAFLYTKSINIFGNSTTAGAKNTTKGIRIEFFPEGGNFIGGLNNSIAFKATHEDGLPAEINGTIRKENGEKVASFSSYHDGMGYFDLAASEKENYYALLDDDATSVHYPLPALTANGLVLRILTIGNDRQFEIVQRPGQHAYKAAYMIGQMQHHVVFRTDLKPGKDEMTGMIQTGKLPSGILQVTVFNNEGLPLAERLTFIDNKEYILKGEMKADTLDFSKRGRNHFELSIADTVKGSFSVSVYDAGFEKSTNRSDNIVSGLLLTGDLKGYIHEPSWYFSTTPDSSQNGLDLVMMTNGWRRFRWEEIAKGKIPSVTYADPEFIKVAGRINLEGTKKPFTDKPLLAFIVTDDSSRTMQMIQTNSSGDFQLDSLIFYGNAKVFFSDIKGKRSKFIDVKLNGDSLHRRFPLPTVTVLPVQTYYQQQADNFSSVLKAEGLMLEEIKVSASKKTRLQVLEEQYVSGAFSGDANRTIDFAEEDLTPYRNILDYLQFRVPGLQIQLLPDGGGYSVLYRQQTMASAMGELPMGIFLNEVPTDADVLSTIPATDIVLIKIFGSLPAATGNGAGGVLAVYTRKGLNQSAYPLAGEMISYNGYSVVKEFYSPDYRVTKSKQPDRRITLYWNPSVIVADIEPKIPIVFYNNDITKRFKVVVEGLTTDGRMLMIEKTIGGLKAF